MFVPNYSSDNDSGRCSQCGKSLDNSKSNDVVLLKYENAKLLAIVKECKQELNELNYGGYESTDKLVGKIEQTLAEVRG